MPNKNANEIDHISNYKASFPQVIDSTILSSISCPRKFFYRHCMHLSGAKSVHLNAGGALAKALQVARNAFYKDNKSQEESLLLATRAFINEWGEYDPEGHYKDFVNVLSAVFSYFYTYPMATDHIQPFRNSKDNSPAVEFTFALPLPIKHPETGEPLLFSGRCDMIGTNGSTTCVVDEKTTYAFQSNWSNQFLMRGQFMGYCWAAQQHGIKTNTAVVRGIAIQQRNIKHQEAIFSLPQWQIERWYNNALDKIQIAIDHWNAFKSFGLEALPMDYGNACSAYSGCEFTDLCTSEFPENWFDSFERIQWNPLEVEEN